MKLKNQNPIDIKKDIPKFEKLNDIKINIFGLDEKLNLTIIYTTKLRKPHDEIVNLLSITNDETNNNHLCLIRNMSALTNSNDTKEHHRYICWNCLNFKTYKEDILNSHLDNCIKNEANKCILPKEGKNMLKFGKDEGNKFMHPFYICADFESTLIPICKNDDDKYAKTVFYQDHTPNNLD